jgi:signal transduction histidine kinase
MTAKRLILPLLLLLLCFAFSCKYNGLTIPNTVLKTSQCNAASLIKNKSISYSRSTEINYIKKLEQAETLRQAEADDRDLRLQISSDHNKLLLVCLVFTIFSSLFVYFLILQRHKRERLMESYITETRIAKKVHDEIANEIYGTINYLATNDSIPAANKEQLISRLDDIYLMTKNISRETNNIDTGYQYPEHLKIMLSSYSDNSVNIIIKGINDINWNAIDAIKKIAGYRSLQEIMVNMKKHSQATLVIVDFSMSSKKIKISYTDNGRGASQSELLQKNGIVNIEDRMAAVEGSLNLETNPGKGFHITLTYPIQMSYV